MIINPYVISLMTKEDADAMYAELMRVFDGFTSKELPQLSELLHNLSLLRKAKESKER